MSRTKGARNGDYEERRLSLARKVRAGLMSQPGLDASLRQLAIAAGSSTSTLKHYFKDRQGLLEAVLHSLHVDGAPHLAVASTPTTPDVRASLLDFLNRIKTAWFRYGVGRLQSQSLALGLSVEGVGPAYLNSVLEPLLQSLEALLRRHVELGRLKLSDVRVASLQLLAPIVLGLLHQDSLGGAGCRPLDVDAFLVTQVEDFLKAHPPVRPARARA